MKKTRLILPLLGTAVSVFANHFDGGKAVPVHRIPLTAEDGQGIVPTMPHSMPFSAKMTCGACHDYEKIHSGTHFAGAGEGRSTEPWIVVDEKSGTQVPADRRHLSAWEFTKQFGSHLPGGAISDPEDKLANPESRWDVSGGLEINCMACHSQSPRQDMTEWAKQIGRENFRWAATAASGIGEVGGMASRLPDYWNIYDGANPDDHVFAVPPSVNYDSSLFDSKHRAWLDIGKPQDKSCLYCHTTYSVGTPRMELQPDVHTAAGLACVDCHRNGEDHQILRGTTAAMSCAAGHIQTGQLGAPIAAHKGLPPIHLEKLTCTACHSGSQGLHTVRTSRANRLGIHGRAQWFTESPFIVEPVFVENDEGKIEPRRMMWPAYWAYQDGIPIDDDLVEQAATGVLDAAQQVGTLLGELAGSENALGEPLFATGGNLYRRNTDGGLDRVGKMNTPLTWLWSTGTNMVSTIPEFDAKAEEIDYDAEGAIVAIMDALKPLDVMLVTQGKRFAKNDGGYLEGTNSTQAAGWYLSNGQPLVSPFVARAVADTVGSSFSFNEEQLALMLKKLGNSVCYVSNGRKFTLDAGGGLADSDAPFAEPVSWPLGHDVRPETQALGAKGCEDCHSLDSGFLFGSVAATGPLLTARAKTVPMYEFQGLDESFNKMFGLTFKVRKAFKGLLGILAALLGLVALAVGLPALYRLAGKLEDTEIRGLTPLGVVCIAVLAVTGFLGFALLIHVAFGGLYAILLLLWILLHAKSGRSIWFWMLLLCGIVLILSVLLAMFPILGSHGQQLCIAVHRWAAILTVVAAAGCFIMKRGK